MVTDDNPAGRLYTVFLNAKRLQPPDSTNVLEVYADALSMQAGHIIDPFDGIHQMRQLVRETRDGIEVLDVDHEPYSATLAMVEAALDSRTMLGETWKRHNDRLSEALMLTLQFVSGALSKSRGEALVESKVLSELQADIESISEKILQSNLPNDLREFFVDSLQRIRTAILEYRLRGPQAVRSVVDSTFGAAFRHREEIDAERDNPVVRGFFAVFKKAEDMIAVAFKAKQLTAPLVSRFLELSSGA